MPDSPPKRKFLAISVRPTLQRPLQQPLQAAGEALWASSCGKGERARSLAPAALGTKSIYRENLILDFSPCCQMVFATIAAVPTLAMKYRM